MIMMIVFLCTIQMSTRAMKETEKGVELWCDGKTKAATMSGLKQEDQSGESIYTYP